MWQMSNVAALISRVGQPVSQSASQSASQLLRIRHVARPIKAIGHVKLTVRCAGVRPSTL